MSEVKNIPILRFSGYNDSWESYYLNEVTKVYDGTHQTPKYVEDGVPFYSVETVTSNDFSNTKFISQKVYEKEIKRVKIESGDVLMTRIGDIGTSKLITWNIPCSFYVSLALIKGFDDCTSGFLKYFFDSNYFQSQLWQKTLHVAYPKKINLGELNTCKILIPSLSEQQKIADFLTEVDKRIELLEKKKTLLETYKKGVMKKIFNQEIRCKDNNGNDFPDWEETTLGKLAKITTGDSNRSDSESFGDYMFFDRSVDVRMSSTYSFDTEAIIVAGEGKDFIPRYYNGKFGLHQRTYAIYDFINSDAKFLYYWIYYFRYFFLKTSVGSTMPSLRMNSFTKFPVSKPTKEEQVKISKFLSSIDNQIELLETQIDKSKTWKKGLLQKMFV